MAWKSHPSYPNYLVNHLGKVKNINTGKIVSGSLNESGYRRVTFYKNKRPRSFYLHRIVAFLFCDNPRNLNEVHHINGKRDDNRSCNLQFVTRQENMKFVYIKHRADYRHKNEQQAINLQYV